MPSQGSRKDIALVIAAAFCFTSSFMMVPPIITGFAESLGATSMLMGVIGGLSNVVSLVFRPFIGNLTDRFSKFKIACASAVLIFLASLGYLFSFHPMMIAGSRILAGIGYTCYTVCMGTWVAEMAPQERIGSYMGIFGVALATAMGISPAVGVGVYQRWGYRPAFIVAILFIVLALTIIQFVRNPGKPAGVSADDAPKKFQFLAWNVLPITVVTTLFAIPVFATHAFLVRYAETREIPVMAGLFFPAYSAVLVTLRLMLKNLFDRVPFQRFLWWCTAASLAGFVCFALMDANWLLCAGAAFTAAGFGLMFSVAQANAIIMAGPGRRGLGNSTFFVGIDLGMALGPIVGGALYGGLPIAWFFPSLFIFPLITIPLWWISRKIWR